MGIRRWTLWIIWSSGSVQPDGCGVIPGHRGEEYPKSVKDRESSPFLCFFRISSKFVHSMAEGFWYSKGNHKNTRMMGCIIMNILFFLTPKNDVAYIQEDDSIRQAMERMEYHKYSAVPILARNGAYMGTITEGDLLWGIKNEYHLNLKEAEGIPVTALKRRMDYIPVSVKSNMEDLIDRALNQNFVPVLDDRGLFIGIITRKDIIKYYYNKYQE